jgi:hypothetical protein
MKVILFLEGFHAPKETSLSFVGPSVSSLCPSLNSSFKVESEERALEK